MSTRSGSGQPKSDRRPCVPSTGQACPFPFSYFPHSLCLPAKHSCLSTRSLWLPQASLGIHGGCLPLSTLVSQQFWCLQTAPLIPGVSFSWRPVPGVGQESGGQREAGTRAGARLLTHTPGAALLWLGHRLGAVDRRAVEAVAAHMGTLKATQGSVLVPRSHCLPPSSPQSPSQLQGTVLVLSLRWDKSDKLRVPSLSPSPAHLSGSPIRVPPHHGGGHRVPGFAQILCICTDLVSYGI